MKISLLSHKSPEKNEIEDAFYVSPNQKTFGVFDGVTPLTPDLFKGGHNGAYLASHHLAGTLESAEDGENLAEWLISANDSLMRVMNEAGISVDDRHLRWASCAAVIRITGNRLEFVQCGDCMIAAENRDGNVRILTEDSVKGISDRARLYREKARNLGAAVPPESFYDENPVERMKSHRSLANRPEGYSVANGDKEFREYIQTGEIDLTSVTRIFLMSDGLFHPEWSLEEVCKEAFMYGLENYAEALRYKEHTLGHRHDDMTGIIIER
ncbi:protein phosphatase 2C domain-containing protein [Metabacillus sp. 84]|uniref:protein phosphatase 2C domain-containing protein n=1 Tax=unclassified Metabacillus TaxID=2675274 RepID=UPI003CEF5ADD